MNKEVPALPALVGLAVGIFLASFLTSTLMSSLVIGVCVGASVVVGRTLKMRRLRKQSGITATGDPEKASGLISNTTNSETPSKVGWFFRILALLISTGGSFALWAMWNPSTPDQPNGNLTEGLAITAFLGGFTLFMGYVGITGKTAWFSRPNVSEPLAAETNPNILGFRPAIQIVLDPLKGQEVPSDLRDIYGEIITQWPIGRIGTQSLAKQSKCRFLKKIDLELIRSDEELAAGQETLRQFAQSKELSTLFKLAPGCDSGQTIDLPWLDVKKALCIGGGADYGDDVWLVLDFRIDSDSPRVLANEWVHGETSECFWREVASSLEEFLRVLTLNTKPKFGNSL